MPELDHAAAAAAAGRLEGAAPEEVLAWALEHFHPELVIASSMTDAVLVDMASRLQYDVPVLFCDTGYHFAETLEARDTVAAAYRVRVLSVDPAMTVSEQDARFGARLFERDPDLCCRMRKVIPFDAALGRFRAWASGIRRDESVSRSDVQEVEWDARREMVKINPLARWSQRDVEDYIASHKVVTNPLVAEGYLSIGCAPCTRRVQAGDDSRSGRWSGSTKIECGLHT